MLGWSMVEVLAYPMSILRFPYCDNV
jgi:hypothetical protein